MIQRGKANTATQQRSETPFKCAVPHKCSEHYSVWGNVDRDMAMTDMVEKWTSL